MRGTTILVAICFVGTSQFADGQEINYADFSSTSGLNLVGDTSQNSNRLRLTTTTTLQGGAAWFAEKQTVEDGFETTFEFQITNFGGTAADGVDGLAFLIQNDNVSALGGLGGAVGYGNDSLGNPGILNSVAMELDGVPNSYDPDSNHISVNTRGVLQNSASHAYSLGSTPAIPEICDGNIHTVRILYLPGTMDVFVDGSLTPDLTVPLDLASTLNLDDGKAWLGFTASTGATYANQDILSWSATMLPEPATLSLLALGAPTLLRRRR